MNLQEIMQGESKNVEFKVELPKKSEKYMKSVIAFSNTSGGKIVIGVNDVTGQIIGVDEKEVFRIMDSIANAVSDNCEPQIVPDVTFQTIDGKCVIIIEIYPGSGRPYFFKSVGKNHGTYIRVGGTSRPADETKIKELELEGANLSWDELTCIGYKVTEEAVNTLCADIYRYMLDSVSTEEEKKEVHKVTKEHLLNWGVLKSLDGELTATNAFVLLTDSYFRFSKIQCALFKGTDRDVFIDKKEYSGSLYEQIEDAYKFVLKHINLGADIEGLVRKDAYELPIAAIREMIVNAVCHRNYMDNSCVQVAVYDNRVEVTSPGMLYGGLTLEEAMRGRSKIRNRAIAEVLSRMEIVESWGTGIKRIMNRAKEYGLTEPEFLEIGDTFRVNLFRKADKKPIKADKKPIQTDKKPIKTDKKPIKADKKPIQTDKKPIKADKKPIQMDREQMILEYIQENGSISNKEAREILGLAESTVKRLLKQMVDNEELYVRGEKRTRKYYR
ncbi:putative DNA binding domain-containing protein [Lachnospiraceae bacterium OttesenSCG-928-D06]|nr:putative DNA binding domain-containing protein [Lachnospiraceae bacterium OttesenSCG-928-D06]